MGNKLLFCTLLALSCCAGIQAQSCPDTLYINTPFEAGYQHLEAQSVIVADNSVAGTAKITYDAGEYVLLQPGFYAASTELFWAVTDGCDGSVTDTEESAWLSGTTAAPNPTTGQLQLKFAQPSDQALQVRCFDLVGRQLLSAELPDGSGTADLDLSALPAGVYLLRLSGIKTAQSMTLRVVKQ